MTGCTIFRLLFYFLQSFTTTLAYTFLKSFEIMFSRNQTLLMLKISNNAPPLKKFQRLLQIGSLHLAQIKSLQLILISQKILDYVGTQNWIVSLSTLMIFSLQKVYQNVNLIHSNLLYPSHCWAYFYAKIFL